MKKLRKSSAENPLSQQEVLDYVAQNESSVFYVQKIKIPVNLTRVAQKENVNTDVVARDGRKIHETSNTAQTGDGIDTRLCADGSVDQYVKKPHKVAKDYTIDDGRKFDEISMAETTAAHTDCEDIRKAFVAENDLYMASTWGAVQFVARGSIVTICEGKAIGNNNPCDMVLHTEQGNGREVLNKRASDIRFDAIALKLPLSKGAEKFLQIAAEEDAKCLALMSVNEENLLLMVKERVSKMKMRVAKWKEKVLKSFSLQRIERKVTVRNKERS